MDWNSIFTFLTGALAALIPIIVTNWFQARERAKDRLEQRREAKIHAIEKLMGSDIDKVLDLLSRIIKGVSEYQNYNVIKQLLDIRRVMMSEEEYKKQLSALMESHIAQSQEITTIVDSIGGLIYSFDDDISSEYDMLKASMSIHISSIQLDEVPSKSADRWNDVVKRAGNLQRMLRGKLITLRD